MLDLDTRIRLAAFSWLEQRVIIHEDVLPRSILQQGFEFEGYRIPLVSPQGIFKPKEMQYPISITTAPEGPYDDSFDSDGLLIYKYRKGTPQHPDNVGLRILFQKQIPLIYFHGIIPGKYLAVWPVYIVDDNVIGNFFRAAVDDKSSILKFMSTQISLVADSEENIRRKYITATVKNRLHQQSFRERVLAAYNKQCAFCRLRHEELLDAAHILPDSDPEGKPVVTNGIALCKFHHAAFDKFFIGIRPDYVLEVKPSVLKEKDGPMLLHGLQGLHHAKIILPSIVTKRPDVAFLERRYQQFREVR